MNAATQIAVFRQSGCFLLDYIVRDRFATDIIDALITIVVSMTNVDPINRNPALQLRYATFDAPPPDESRRPVSLNAIAEALNMSVETVRRRVSRQTMLGRFRSTRQGIFIPTKPLFEQPYRASLTRGYERARGLYEDLARINALEAYPGENLWPDELPLRLVARITTNYGLRLMQVLIDVTGDPVSAAIWLTVICSGAGEGTGETFGIPLSAREVARRLALPEETVRRKLHALIEKQLCAREDRGVFVDRDAMELPPVRRLFDRNCQDVRRMFAGLAEFGVVQAWQAAR